ncbi:hypothetical protein Pint_05732 [Pistacia integerrima]|uniref:Uncharacterized protein n=1 Tax=Pistacia integerrima TaxID=434235 RepID=A0ACC0Z3C1_9ROSI|nr:hypothetical protein Pint_05732 [Pistacia integerrima]
MLQILGDLGMSLFSTSAKGSASAPYALGFQKYVHSTSQKDFENGRNSRPMDFVRDSRPTDFVRDSRPMDFSQFPRYSVEQNADVVHMKFLFNNTFVTVTDSKGNKKMGASWGCLPELKGAVKMSRYAPDATAEHVGRLAKNMGLKSFVMKVNGFTYFRRKKQAILSFREGFGNSRNQNPIVYIEDTTRKPHNGCRLRKQRRI